MEDCTPNIILGDSSTTDDDDFTTPTTTTITSSSSASSGFLDSSRAEDDLSLESVSSPMDGGQGGQDVFPIMELPTEVFS